MPRAGKKRKAAEEHTDEGPVEGTVEEVEQEVQEQVEWLLVQAERKKELIRQQAVARQVERERNDLIESLEDQVNNAKQRATEAEERARTAEMARAEQAALLDRLQEQVQILVNERAIGQQAHETQAAVIARLEKEKTEARDTIEGLENQFTTYVVDDLPALVDELEVLENSIPEYERTIGDLRDDVQRYRLERNAARDALSELKDQREGLEVELERQDDTIEDLEREKAEQQDLIEALEREKAKQQDLIEALEREKAEQRDRLEGQASNATSLALKLTRANEAIRIFEDTAAAVAQEEEEGVQREMADLRAQLQAATAAKDTAQQELARLRAMEESVAKFIEDLATHAQGRT
jgi:chromosome segregation ATPase